MVRCNNTQIIKLTVNITATPEADRFDARRTPANVFRYLLKRFSRTYVN